MQGPRSLAEYVAEFAEYQGFPAAPAARREVSRERRTIEKYLLEQDGAWSRTVQEAATGLPKMDEAVRCVVLLPARHEERRIAQSLDALLIESATGRASVY